MTSNRNSSSPAFQDYVTLARPEQWLKNMFVFLPLFFSGRASFVEHLWSTLIAFVAFSLVASAIYCINDVADRTTDRRHPRKRHRPVASGRVTSSGATTYALLLAAAGFGMTAAVPRGTSLAIVLSSYLALNLLYTFRLKQVQVIDIFIIASGFVLRLFAGSVVCDITLSCWIEIVTFVLAMFLAMAKRRSDLLIMLRTNDVQRQSLVGYTREFVDASLGILGAVTILAYIMYTVSPEISSRAPYFYATSVFVVLGVLRYLFRVLATEKGGNPVELLLTDRWMVFSVVAWIITCGIFIYY